MKNKILSRWFGQSNQSDNSPQMRIRSGLTVLVVDDSRTQLYAMEKMLNAQGVKTYAAENGRQGILMAKHVKPDLILMDIVMPEINGFQATRYLSRQEATKHIPIIIVSGTEQGSDKVWGLKLGAKDYIQKPANKELLFEKINRWTAEVSGEKKPSQSIPASSKAVSLDKAV